MGTAKFTPSQSLLVSLAPGTLNIALIMLIVAQLCFGVGFTVFNVNQASLRQVAVPAHLQGRASATVRVLALSLAPLGAIVGGLLAEVVGLRHTLVIAAVGELGAAWLWWSPIRHLTEMPDLIGADSGPDVFESPGP